MAKTPNKVLEAFDTLFNKSDYKAAVLVSELPPAQRHPAKPC